MTLVPTAPPFQEESMGGKVMGLTPTGWVWKLTNQKKKKKLPPLFIHFLLSQREIAQLTSAQIFKAKS